MKEQRFREFILLNTHAITNHQIKHHTWGHDFRFDHEFMCEKSPSNTGIFQATYPSPRYLTKHFSGDSADEMVLKGQILLEIHSLIFFSYFSCVLKAGFGAQRVASQTGQLQTPRFSDRSTAGRLCT